MGMPGMTISHPDDVECTLEKAFREDGPVLISIQTDPNALAMPPKLEFHQMKGFAVYMTKMILEGRIREVANIISSNYRHLGDIFS